MNFFIDRESIETRIKLLDFGERGDKNYETFVLLFSRKDMKKIANSGHAHFKIRSQGFKINKAVRNQIKEIIE